LQCMHIARISLTQCTNHIIHISVNVAVRVLGAYNKIADFQHNVHLYFGRMPLLYSGKELQMQRGENEIQHRLLYECQ
jgi:hypothetical protein